MKTYGDLSGKSGVVAFELKDRGIVVKFRGGAVYEYNYSRPGKEQVEKMKLLAVQGRGLSTYISQQVKGQYAAVYK